MSNEKNCGFCLRCADDRFFCLKNNDKVHHDLSCQGFVPKIEGDSLDLTLDSTSAYVYVMPFVSDKRRVVFVERCLKQYFKDEGFKVVNESTGELFVTTSWTKAVSLALYGFDDDMNGVFDCVYRSDEMFLALQAMQRYYTDKVNVILDLEYSQDFMER